MGEITVERRAKKKIYNMKTIVIWLLSWRRGGRGRESECMWLTTAPFVGVLSSKVLYIILFLGEMVLYIICNQKNCIIIKMFNN